MTALIDNTTRAKNLLRNVDGVQPTYREILERGFVERGFISKKFSHKKEPANRRADSLLLNFDSLTTTASNASTVLRGNGRKTGFGASEMVAEIAFYEGAVEIFIRHKSQDGGCFARDTGKVKFTQYYSALNPTVVFNYVDAILNRENLYEF